MHMSHNPPTLFQMVSFGRHIVGISFANEAGWRTLFLRRLQRTLRAPCGPQLGKAAEFWNIVCALLKT